MLVAAFWLCLAAFVQPVQADTLDWNTRPATNLRTGGTDAAVINGVTVTTSGAIAGGFDGTGNILAIQPTATANGTTGYVNTTLDASVDNESVSQTTTVTFSEPVYNLSVVVGDIDGGPTFTQSGASFNDIVEFRANGGTVLPTSGTPVNATRVTWTAATGRASANNFNVTDNSGNVTVTFAGPITSFTVRHIAGANSNVTNPTTQFIFIETVTYTRSPRLALTKISNGGVGTFNFSGDNGFGGYSITTAVSGTGVVGATRILSLANTTTTVTEAIPAGYLVTAINCTGLGSGGTATPNLATGAVVLNAAAVAPGVTINCTYTNGKRPTVQARKISIGNVGAFNFSGTNGYAADTITTVTSNVAVAGAVRTLTTASTATTITEAIPSGYTVTAITCTGLGGGTATPNLAAGSVTLNAAATAAANAVVCTFTNTKIPTLRVQKITTSGFGGPFQFSMTNPATVLSPITTTAANTAQPASPTPVNIATIGTQVTVTETVASGYSLTSASCTDSNASITGNSGSFGALAGNILTVPAARVVAGAEFLCVFTNLRLLPAFTLSKSQTSGPNPVTDAGQTIGYSITLQNTGNQALTGVAITSDTLTTGAGSVSLTPAYASGDLNSNSILDVGESWIYTASYTVTQNDVDAIGGITNSATATTSQVGPQTTSSPSTPITRSPGLFVEKDAVPKTPAAVGQVITYTFKVTNTGNVTISGVHITDTFYGAGGAPVPGSETLFFDELPLGNSTDLTASDGSWSTLSPDDVVIFTATYTVTQQDIDQQ